MERARRPKARMHVARRSWGKSGMVEVDKRTV